MPSQRLGLDAKLFEPMNALPATHEHQDAVGLELHIGVWGGGESPSHPLADHVDAGLSTEPRFGERLASERAAPWDPNLADFQVGSQMLDLSDHGADSLARPRGERRAEDVAGSEGSRRPGDDNGLSMKRIFD